jgi:hypothetical protein
MERKPAMGHLLDEDLALAAELFHLVEWCTLRLGEMHLLQYEYGLLGEKV